MLRRSERGWGCDGASMDILNSCFAVGMQVRVPDIGFHGLELQLFFEDSTVIFSWKIVKEFAGTIPSSPCFILGDKIPASGVIRIAGLYLALQ